MKQIIHGNTNLEILKKINYSKVKKKIHRFSPYNYFVKKFEIKHCENHVRTARKSVKI